MYYLRVFIFFDLADSYFIYYVVRVCLCLQTPFVSIRSASSRDEENLKELEKDHENILAKIYSLLAYSGIVPLVRTCAN